MTAKKWAAFEKQTYLNLETFRKNGEGVKTPVWFMRSGDVFYVRTSENSGKVKRIRRNSDVRITPCTGSGKALGDWIDATALETKDTQQVEEAHQLASKKYGLTGWIFELMGKVNRRVYTTLVIRLN